MMKRETIQAWRRVVNKMDYHPDTNRERQLMDSHLEALDLIDRLKDELEQRANDIVKREGVIQRVQEAVEPHVGYQASERGALARKVARITKLKGWVGTGWGIEADERILRT